MIMTDTLYLLGSLNGEIPEYTELKKIFTYNDINEFRRFLDRFNTDELIYEFKQKHPDKDKLNFTIANFIKSVATCLVVETDNDAMLDILIDEYGFIPDKEFFMNSLVSISYAMLKIFHKYFDLLKYANLLRPTFINLCIEGRINEIEDMLNMGFDINVLNGSKFGYSYTGLWMAIMCDKNDTIKYLLDNGVTFKQHEIDILKVCVKNNKYDVLKLFISYGADLQTLNLVQNNMPNNKMETYNLLVSENIRPEIILQLMSG